MTDKKLLEYKSRHILLVKQRLLLTIVNQRQLLTIVKQRQLLTIVKQRQLLTIVKQRYVLMIVKKKRVGRDRGQWGWPRTRFSLYIGYFRVHEKFSSRSFLTYRDSRKFILNLSSALSQLLHPLDENELREIDTRVNPSANDILNFCKLNFFKFWLIFDVLKLER